MTQGMKRSGAAMNAQNSNARSHAVGSSSLKNRTAKPTRRKGMGNDPNTCSAEALRSEEHTSELQSLAYLVCRLLLEKKKQQVMMKISTLTIVSPITHHAA